MSTEQSQFISSLVNETLIDENYQTTDFDNVEDEVSRGIEAVLNMYLQGYIDVINGIVETDREQALLRVPTQKLEILLGSQQSKALLKRLKANTLNRLLGNKHPTKLAS